MAGIDHLRVKRVRQAGRFPGPACECCGKEFSEDRKDARFDHCHDSGSFRGWVCAHCNTMLGFARDDPEVLEAGAAYLRRFNEV